MVSAEYEIRAFDRARIVAKEGKSIMELIKEGRKFNFNLLKEFEQEVSKDIQRAKEEETFESNEDKSEYDGTLVNIDGEWKPEFDEDGYSINY